MVKQDIPQQLAASYAQLVDDRRFTEMETIMWPDLTQQGPGFHADSREVFINNLEFLRHYDRTFHMVGQQTGEWNGDTYNGETYCVASHFYQKDGIERRMDMGIRYQETIEIRDGQAKYRRRDLNVVWNEDREMGASA